MSDRTEEFFIYKTGFKVELVSDLIEALLAFKQAKGNMPIFYDNDCKHEEIEFFSVEPEVGCDGSLNENLPRRLVIS